MTEIVIADSSFLAREGLKKLLEADESFKVTGEIKNSRELWFKLSSLKPDILIFNYDDKKSFENSELIKIKQYSPSTGIIVFSNSDDKNMILNIIKQGAFGYLTKECEAEEIYKALESVSAGERFICSKALDVLLHESPGRNGNSQLSSREVEIVTLITEGKSNQQIAEKLFISIHTVYTHRKNIMKKLNLKSPVELVLYALNSGITEN